MGYINKTLSIIIISILFFYENELIFETKIENEYMNKKYIFTFWEPKDKIPGYLCLCMKTWKKFLPDYQIKVFDYKTIKEYLGRELFFKIICKQMPLSMQADAIRVALLAKFGGIWMDADTIILNGSLFNEIKNFELSMIGVGEYHYIGFIFSNNHSSILNEWLKMIINKVKIYKNNLKNKNKDNESNDFLEKIKSFDYLGNSIIDPLLKNTSRKEKEFFCLASNRINIFPERNLITNSSLDIIEKYRLFYFHKGDYLNIFNISKHIILLHNSWTPLKYKNMSENEFLKQDILLSKLLEFLLKEK